MAIDRADWHSDGDFPSDISPDNGGTHIGFFLAWIITTGLIGDEHQENSTSAIEKVRKREMTGRQFLYANCDGKFWDDDLNEEGLKFTNSYYNDKGYFKDLSEALPGKLPTIYHAEDSWKNYDVVAERIEAAYEKWKLG